MSKEDKFEYFFFYYIYKYLKVDDVEKYFENNGISIYDGDVSNPELRFAKYFSFLSRGKIDNFSNVDKNEFNRLFNFDIMEIFSNMDIYNNVMNFVIKNYNNYFFSDIDSNYEYYGLVSGDYIAPSDAIVLGINYCKYNYDETYQTGSFEELALKKESIINSMINKIQFDIAPKHNLKVAVIKCNEFYLDNNFTRI